MPVEVAGLKELQKAMRSIQPDLSAELKTEIKSFLNPLVKKAKRYAPVKISGLSNWTIQGKKITAKSSSFNTGFPRYSVIDVRRGIKSEIYPTKPNRSGFVSLVRIVNQSAGGSIYETAGRKNPNGQTWNRKSGSHKYSHSRNPQAGKHFIESMGEMAGTGKSRGRLIYRAWDEDQGKALAAIMKAVEKTAIHFKARVDIGRTFKKAA